MFNFSMNIDDIRRGNARMLAEQTDSKHPIKGLANKLGKPHALMSHYIGKNPTKNIGPQIAREIEVAYGHPEGWMDTPHFQDTIREQSRTYALPQLIPIKGCAQLGDGGFWETFEYPEGHGDGYIQWYSDDPDAYAVQGIGDSMAPRIRHKEYAIIEPNRTVFNGDEVFVVTSDGRRMVKIFLYFRDDRVHLESTNADHEKIVLLKQEVLTMHYVAGIAKAKAKI